MLLIREIKRIQGIIRDLLYKYHSLLRTTRASFSFLRSCVCTLRFHQGLQCSSNISVNTLGRCGRRIVTNEGDREQDREKGQDVGERSKGVEKRTKRGRVREGQRERVGGREGWRERERQSERGGAIEVGEEKKREGGSKRGWRMGEEDTKRPYAVEGPRETTTGTVSENRIRGEQVTGGREPVRVAGGGVSSFSTPVLPRTAQSGA